MNIFALLKSGLSGAISPLNANGRLNIIPIINPCIDQCLMERQLIPIANPIKVRLTIICTAIGHASSPEPLEARPKQINPKSTPARVATMMRFAFYIVISFLNGY